MKSPMLFPRGNTRAPREGQACGKGRVALTVCCFPGETGELRLKV